MIKIGNIKDYFEDKILERGFNYYKEDKIINVAKYNGKEHYIANISGTNIYTVDINLVEASNTKISMKCNCPYGYDGTPCKHEAALLYYLKSDNCKIREIKEYPLNDSLKKLMDRLDNEIEDTIDACEDEEEFENVLEPIFSKYCNNAIDLSILPSSDSIDLLFALYNKLLDTRNDIWFYHYEYYGDNHRGPLNDFENIFDVLDEALNKILEKDNKYPFAVERYLNLTEFELYKRLIDILYNKANTKEKRLMLYDTLFKITEDGIYNNIEELISRVIIEYKDLNIREFEYLKQIYSIDDVIYRLVYSQEYEVVICILENLNLIDSLEYRNYVIECYKYTNKDKCIKFLNNLIREEKSFEYYVKLRELVPFSMDSEAFKCVESVQDLNQIFRLYEFEKLYEKMWDRLSKEDFIVFQKYEVWLGNKYNDKILERYSKEMVKDIKINHRVNKETLFGISKKANGKEAVIAIIAEVRKMDLSRYPQLEKDLEFVEMTIL